MMIIDVIIDFAEVEFENKQLFDILDINYLNFHGTFLINEIGEENY